MKKIVLLAFVLMLLSTAVVVTFVRPITAQERTVGVSEGDWFKYGNIVVNWSSDNPNATFPQEWKDLKETEWFRVTVTEISGETISLQTFVHYKNGTERGLPDTGDIDIGNGHGGHTFIGANLSAGDPVYTSGSQDWWINETIVQDYPEGIREVNHMNMSATQDGYWASVNLYWDRLTGVLVEQNYESTNQTGEYMTNFSILARITESNVWAVPEFPSFLILPLFMIATLLTVIAYRRKHTVQH